MQPPPPPGASKEKEEGPAEEAPEETRPADLEPLSGYAEQNKRRMQIFELDGYLRLRSDWMHQFALGQGYTVRHRAATSATTACRRFRAAARTAAIRRAAGDAHEPRRPRTTAGPVSHKNIGGANMRFRLQPTINVTDQVRVHALIDVLDNTIMGSTPDTLAGIEGYNSPSATGARATRPAARRPAS